MTKKKPPSQLTTTETPAVPRNAMQRKAARDAGHITGWLKNRKRGAPKKTQPPPRKKKKGTKKIASKKTAAPTSVAVAAAAVVDLSGDAPSPNADNAATNAATNAAVSSTSTSSSKRKAEPSKAPRGQYKNWSIEPYASAMARAIEASLKGLDPQQAAGTIVIPPGTLRKRVKDAKAEAEKGKEGDTLYLDQFQRQKKSASNKSLTTELDRTYLQQLITLRDLKNNGMTRKEVIGVIQKLTGADFDTAQNHWYHCRRKQLLPELKNHGALRTAQSTTTKRSGVTTEKLLRWHQTVEATLIELDRRNGWHKDWEEIKKSNKIDSFWGNCDETNMSSSEGEFTQFCNLSITEFAY